MFDQSRQLLAKLELQQVDNNLIECKNTKMTKYSQPVIHFLGDLKTVQASNSGRNLDGPNSSYFYE